MSLPTTGYVYLPVPDEPGRTIGCRALEVAPDRFLPVDRATLADWRGAAELAAARLRRCKPGSANARWYAAVIAEHERRRRAGLAVLPGGRT